jgi:hypothetical protein
MKPALAILFTLAWGGAADACMSTAHQRRYLSDVPLEHHGDTVMLRVRVEHVGSDVAEARLDGPFALLSPDGRVRIQYSSIDDCTSLGPIDQPVFVIGSLIRYASGALVIQAIATPWHQSYYHHPVEELDRYIVDPAYRTLPPAATSARPGKGK